MLGYILFFTPLFLLLDISIYCIKSDSITNIISKKKSFVNTLKTFSILYRSKDPIVITTTKEQIPSEPW